MIVLVRVNELLRLNMSHLSVLTLTCMLHHKELLAVVHLLLYQRLVYVMCEVKIQLPITLIIHYLI